MLNYNTTYSLTQPILENSSSEIDEQSMLKKRLNDHWNLSDVGVGMCTRY